MSPHGDIFTPILPSGRRTKMRLSHEDQAKITRGLGLKGVVTDLLTGRRWRVYGMACESPNCACDARVVPVRRKWIQSALKRSTKGALHRQLGIPSDEKIPADVLEWASHQPGKLGRRARLAKTLRRLGRQRKRK